MEQQEFSDFPPLYSHGEMVEGAGEAFAEAPLGNPDGFQIDLDFDDSLFSQASGGDFDATPQAECASLVDGDDTGMLGPFVQAANDNSLFINTYTNPCDPRFEDHSVAGMPFLQPQITTHRGFPSTSLDTMSLTTVNSPYLGQALSPASEGLTWDSGSPTSPISFHSPLTSSLDSPMVQVATPAMGFVPMLQHELLIPQSPYVQTDDAPAYSLISNSPEPSVANAVAYQVPTPLPAIRIESSTQDPLLTDRQNETSATDGNKVACTECGHYINNTSRDIGRHMETHKPTVEKIKFPCPFCDIPVGRQDNLRRHVQKAHHQELPSRPRGPQKGSKRAPRRNSGKKRS